MSYDLKVEIRKEVEETCKAGSMKKKTYTTIQQ